MTGLRLTILIVPYMVPRPMEKTGMVLIAIPVNTSPNVENRELTVSFNCELCNRSFGSQDALDQHIQYSKAHIAPTSTPLDKFFRSFPRFRYNPKLPPSESYAQLREFCGWEKENPDGEKAWKKYQSALEAEVKMWFGAEDDLDAWHSLCRAIGIEPLPETCKQAVRVIRGVFVNIIDLIDWARSGSTTNRVQRFSSLEQLRKYTKQTGKCRLWARLACLGSVASSASAVP
ncbi:hypothetical protein DTO012A8_9758 [Penicillium roqueforti]|nr:hypothetical protein DTO012A8_9758 [Penicillium roqueforti]